MRAYGINGGGVRGENGRGMTAAWRHLLAWRRGGIGISKAWHRSRRKSQKGERMWRQLGGIVSGIGGKENLGIGMKRGGGENDRYGEILQHRN
jgi:hypothetical protein